MKGGRRQPEELLYLPLTDHDERVRHELRYRTCRWLSKQAIGLAVAAAIAIPLAFVLDWRDEYSDGLTLSQAALLLALWVPSLMGIYVWWFYRQQDWSELRRAYLFRKVEPEDDVEIADAKRVLLDGGSTPSEREQAVQVLLRRGVCALNKVSIAREALAMLATFVILMLVLFVLVWLL